MDTKKDNSTFKQKVALRRQLLQELTDPVVMETHGGYGKVYLQCYSDFDTGVVFEKDQRKSAHLGKQRPHWSVYEADCERAILAGAGRHLPINFLDLDPYGEPWPVMDAFFESKRPRTDLLCLVVNDGLRQKIKMGGAWSVGSLEHVVKRWGNDIYGCYLDVCQDLIKEKAAQAGYAVSRFYGYYCGYNDQMTHYAAVLEKNGL